MTTPTVGMGVTVYHFTDRTAHTIIRVSTSGKTVWIQRDKAVNIGPGHTQDWDITPDPEGAVSEVRLRGGHWKQVGTKHYVLLGERRERFDFEF
jgi:hypothetical protein